MCVPLYRISESFDRDPKQRTNRAISLGRLKMTAERETGPDQSVQLTFCIFFFLSHNHSPPSERSDVVGIIQLFAVIRTSTNDVIETRIIYLRKKHTSLIEEESPTTNRITCL